MRFVPSSLVQMNPAWHRQGMYMGMHWAWWLFWILTIVLLLWALWRALADRKETHRRAERTEVAEEALRRRFAAGEIDEDEFARRTRVLRESML